MRNKDCISRCLHILCRLKRDQKATFAQIQRYLSDMSILTGEDYNISIRTFQRDLETIRELFLIDIRYSRGEGIYSFSEEFANDLLSERLVESLEVFHSLKMMDNLSGIFHFETRPPLGTHHLTNMITAIKNKRIIKLVYNKNWERNYSERTVLPLLLKEFKGRWYVVAKCMDTDELRTYSLDRIVEFCIQEKRAVNTEDLSGYFHHSFGIYGSTKLQPREVVLRFSSQAGRFVKEATLHHSQEIISDTATDFTIRLNLLITFDFVMEILSYGEQIEVLSPPELRTQIAETLKKAAEKYK